MTNPVHRLVVLLLLPLASALAQDDNPLWDRIKAFDTDGDGIVTRAEFRGPAQAWSRMDPDGDGKVCAADLKGKAARRPGESGPPGTSRGTQGVDLARLDADSDGTVSASEWQAFFDKADENDDKILQPEEWAAAVGGTALSDSAPKVGDPAPKVTAQSLADGKLVDLGVISRPTVLIFGSWT